jgi:hypothetical protein
MAFGVFLAEYGPQGLPYSYIANAILASLVAVLYIRLGEHVSFSTLLRLNLIFLGACTFLAWLGLKSAFAHEVSFLLPLLFQIVANLGSLAVWPLAGRILNFQQAKRLFPLLGVGLWLANTIGGFLVSPLVAWMGAINLLLLAVASTGLAFFVLRLVTNLYLPESNLPQQDQRATGAGKRPAGMFNSRYVFLIFAYVTIWWVAFFFLDNIFSDRAAARFPDVDQLTAFMGQLLSFTGVVALLSSIFLSARVIGRFGLRAGLISEVVIVTSVLGLMVVAGSLGGGLTIVFALAALAKLLTVALGFSLSQSAYAIVFQPLPTSVRARAQATADGIFQPIASGMAGIGLLALTTGLDFDYLGLSYVYLGLGIGLLVVIWVLSGSYVHALTQAITKRRLGESPDVLPDPASLALLRSRLYDPHPGVALYALHRLESLDSQAVAAALPALIRHPSPDVRGEAFARIEKLRLRTALNDVRKQYSIEQSATVKGFALRALGAIAEDTPELTRALDGTDSAVLRGAFVGLLKYGNGPAAQEKLNELLVSPLIQDRMLAIEVLGEVRLPELYRHLISACDSREAGRAAGQALASIGTDALPGIEAAFSRPDAPRQLLFILAKTLGQIGGAQANHILVSRLSTLDEELRSHILHALSQSGYRSKDLSAVRKAVKAEVEQAAWYCAAHVDLGEAGEAALLIAALEESLKQTRDRALLLLSFVFHGDSIRRAREAFLLGSATQASYALEVMDTQLPAEWKGWIMPLLEELSPWARNQRLAAFFPQDKQLPEERLCAILERPSISFWVRACAEHTYERLFPVAHKGDAAMLSTVEKVLILKTVAMFSQTPDHVLADVAGLLEDVEVAEDETIFKKGDPGDSMYIIVDGRVRVHTEERLLNYLDESDVFGEMALLDPEPRLASVTAAEPTRLFRLDGSPFYQLMAERPEVAAGIIRVLTRLLRDRVRDLSQLEARFKELERSQSGL